MDDFNSDFNVKSLSKINHDEVVVFTGQDLEEIFIVYIDKV